MRHYKVVAVGGLMLASFCLGTVWSRGLIKAHVRDESSSILQRVFSDATGVYPKRYMGSAVRDVSGTLIVTSEVALAKFVQIRSSSRGEYYCVAESDRRGFSIAIPDSFGNVIQVQAGNRAGRWSEIDLSLTNGLHAIDFGADGTYDVITATGCSRRIRIGDQWLDANYRNNAYYVLSGGCERAVALSNNEFIISEE